MSHNNNFFTTGIGVCKIENQELIHSDDSAFIQENFLTSKKVDWILIQKANGDKHFYQLKEKDV
jgi:hypothetical protein